MNKILENLENSNFDSYSHVEEKIFLCYRFCDYEKKISFPGIHVFMHFFRNFCIWMRQRFTDRKGK